MFSAKLEHVEGPSAQSIIDAVNLITQNVVSRAISIAKTGSELDVALVQDEIEQQLMRESFYRVAKEYILERAAKGNSFFFRLAASSSRRKARCENSL